MKEFKNLEFLSNSLELISNNVNDGKKSLSQMIGNFKEVQEEILNKITDQEDKKKYLEFINLANETIDSSKGKNIAEIQKNIEILKNYGK